MVRRSERATSTGYYTPSAQSRHRYPKLVFVRRMAEIIPRHVKVVDLGAATGFVVTLFRMMDRHYCFGLDGTPGIEGISEGAVYEQDLTGDVSRYQGAADWGLFIEVGEHVPKKLETRLIHNIGQIVREGLIVSWSESTTGIAHVNPMKADDVRTLFVRAGWRVDEDATAYLRQPIAGWRRYHLRKLWVFRRDA